MSTKNFSLAALVPVVTFFIALALIKFTPLNSPKPEASMLYLSVGIYVITFVLAMYVMRSFIAKQWRLFKVQSWTKYLGIAAGYLLTYLIIIGVRKTLVPLLPTNAADTAAAADSVAAQPFINVLLAAILPLLAPFYEELVFRHGLFRNMAQGSIQTWVAALISSFLFGLIHYHNFSSVAATVPYMFVGLFFCGVYQYTKNIFYPIFIHLLLNWINILLGIVGFFVMQAVGS